MFKSKLISEESREFVTGYLVEVPRGLLLLPSLFETKALLDFFRSAGEHSRNFRLFENAVIRPLVWLGGGIVWDVVLGCKTCRNLLMPPEFVAEAASK